MGTFKKIKNKKNHLFLLIIVLVLILNISLVLAVLPQCSDGIDNDGDGKIDALVELNPNNGETWSSVGDPFTIRTLINNKMNLFGYIKIPDEFNGSGALSSDAITAKQVCKTAGYATLKSFDCFSFVYQRCGWQSCHDNIIAKWNESKKNFDLINACNAENVWLSSVYCENKLPACSDGMDNDYDGLTDYPGDLGCASANDNDERLHDSDCENPQDNEEAIIFCYSDSECDDGDIYTYDKCINPRTSASKCINEEIKCINDNDCGFTGFSGTEFCSNNDIFKNYQESKCINPGTTSSFCNAKTTPTFLIDCGEAFCGNFGARYCKTDGNVYHSRLCDEKSCSEGKCFFNGFSEKESLVETCAYGCSSGFCNPECTENSDCFSGKACINNECVAINCINDNDCNDNNPRTEDKCLNPGTINSKCEQKTMICLYNSDCGTDKFLNQLFCKNNNVFDKYLIFKCNSPGTSNSNCTNSIEEKQVQNCTSGCSNGSCIITSPECSTDNDCTKDYYSDKYCKADDVYKDLNDFSCKAGKCVKETKPELVEKCKYDCKTGGKCGRIAGTSGGGYEEEDYSLNQDKKSYFPVTYAIYSSQSDIVNGILNQTAFKIESQKSEITKPYNYFLPIFLLILIIILVILLIAVFIARR